MGDVVHALPAVASIRRSFPESHISWVIDPKWSVLLEGNPHIDRVIPFNRRSWRSLVSTWKTLRGSTFDVAIDLQGLIKSGLLARVSAAPARYGFSASQAREPLAAWFYTHAVTVAATHVVDRNLELARAAGAQRPFREFPLPQGRSEGALPSSPFVLACPLAGWASKQWPLEYYAELAVALRRDNLTLVVNGAPEAKETLSTITGAVVHTSGIEGLIDATRRAAGIVGVDSGPMHLGAALGKPGVAIFGPTDPTRNGPYSATITVLRDPSAPITYKRGATISSSMRSVKPGAVREALRIRLAFDAERTRV
jgi:heptosyltransferase-1